MWKTGQRVWCILRGPGVVHEVTNRNVIVNFGTSYSKNIIYFGLDGRMSPNFKRSLYFSEPKIDAAEKPPFKKTFDSGEIVVTKSKPNEVIRVTRVQEEFPDCIAMTDGSSFHKTQYDFFRVGAAKVEFN